MYFNQLHLEFQLHKKVRIEHERNPCAEERPKLGHMSSMPAQTYEDDGMQGPQGYGGAS